jgi:hypothetical protein
MILNNDKKSFKLMKKRILISIVYGFIVANILILYPFYPFENWTFEIVFDLFTSLKYILGIIIYTMLFSFIILPIYGIIVTRKKDK